MDDLSDLPLPAEISAADRRILTTLIDQTSNEGGALKQLWRAMDTVWDEMGLDNRQLDLDRLGEYYRHPVWLLNGLFAEADPTSLGHRQAVAGWLADRARKGSVSRMIEFGGGFGTLARLVSASGISVEVLEPFPHRLALERAWSFPALAFLAEPRPPYDALVAMDVLEHVPDPAALLVDLTRWVRKDGFLIFQNHFAPCIKCHLPGTFHLALTFDRLAKLCGLTPMGLIDGSCASVYRKATVRVPPRWRLGLFDFNSRNVPRYRRWRVLAAQMLRRVGIRRRRR